MLVAAWAEIGMTLEDVNELIALRLYRILM